MKQIHSLYSNILKERIEQYGMSNLMDEEALSILTGIPIVQAREYINFYGFAELPKFMEGFEITKSQKKKLELLYHLVKRISLSPYKDMVVLNSSESAGKYLIKEMQYLREEHFNITLLNSQNKLIESVTLFKGTINEAVVYPREVVRVVIEKNATAVILCHNHPGGSFQPSPQDIELTIKIINALKTINVKVIDHIIIAENKFISFAEKGLLNL